MSSGDSVTAAITSLERRLQSQLLAQQAKLEVLVNENFDLRHEVFAIRQCLTEAGVLRTSHINVHLHRQKFAAVQRAHPLSVKAHFRDIFKESIISALLSNGGAPTASALFAVCKHAWAIKYAVTVISAALAEEILAPKNWKTLVVSPNLATRAALMLVKARRAANDELGARSAVFFARHVARRASEVGLRDKTFEQEEELGVRAPTTSAVTLLKAIGVGNDAMVQMLLSGRACVDDCDTDEVHPIILAADRPRQTILKMLLDHRASVAARDSHGRTALLHAASRGNLEGTIALLVANSDINVADDEGATALHMACDGLGGDPDTRQRVIKQLLLRRAHVNAVMDKGLQPIMLAACQKRDPKILSDLINAGASLTHRIESGDRAGFDAFCFASKVDGTHWEAGVNVLRDAMQQHGVDGAKCLAVDEVAFEWAGLVDSLLEVMLSICQEDGADDDDAEHAATGTVMQASRAETRAIRMTETVVSTLLALAYGIDYHDVNIDELVHQSNPLLTVHEYLNARVPPVLSKAFHHGLGALQADEEQVLLLLGSLSWVPDSLPTGCRDCEGRPLFSTATNYKAASNMLASPLYSLVVGRCVCSLQHCLAFAVPSDEALEAIAAHGPICELGAGSGYWAAQLAKRGVDVICFDYEPPGANLNNKFSHRQHTNVLRGGPEVLSKQTEVRALLLVWPFEEELHKQQGDNEMPWDARALATFQGNVVIHVGEFPSEQRRIVNTSPEFVKRLHADFKLEQAIEIPRFAFNLDKLTIWYRRKL